MIGEVVGGQKLLAKLGEGGMGVVYRGRDVTLGRQTAVKMLHPQFSSQKEIVQRFFNEARAAAALRHIGIIEVYSFGYHSDGAAFLVMELLEGESLEARVARDGKLAIGDALRIGKDVCSALAAAHEKQIVHRDLKPENIHLVPDPDFPGGERIKLLDFGIAKLAGEETPAGLATRTGAVLGTPDYMAPEQCRGASEVDARADLYALGCVLYRVLCGRPPFGGAGVGVGDILAAQIRDQPRPPRQLDASIPADLEALILRLLSKRPEERVQTAREVRHALDGFELAPEAETARTVVVGASTPATSRPVADSSPVQSTPVADSSPVQSTPVADSSPVQSTTKDARVVGPAPSGAEVSSRTPLYVAGALAAAGLVAGVIVVLSGGSDDSRVDAGMARATGCGSGDLADCLRRARSHQLGGDAELDYARAAELYQEACDAGSGHGCERLGSFYDKGIGVLADPLRARALWRRACTEEATEGCAALGISLVGNPHGAEEYIRRGCDAGHSSACLALSRLPGEDRSRLRRRALDRAGERCEQGDVSECTILGELIDSSLGRDEKNRLTVLACERGVFEACLVTGQAERGRELAERGCEAGNADICWRFGQLYREGEGDGLERDVARAADFLWRACERRHARSCVTLWQMHSAKEPIDPERLSRACDLAAAACLAASSWLTLELDGDAVAGYLVRGCENGEAEACQEAIVIYRLDRANPAPAMIERLGDRWREIGMAECRDDIVAGCHGLGQYHVAMGEPEAARRAFDRACAARDEASCKALEGLEGKP